MRLAAGFGGIAIVVLTAPNSAIGGAPWAVAAFCIAPILWAAGTLLTTHADRPADRAVANAVQLLAGGTASLLLALSLGAGLEPQLPPGGSGNGPVARGYGGRPWWPTTTRSAGRFRPRTRREQKPLA